MPSEVYLEKLQSVHGIGEATAEKIGAVYETENALLDALTVEGDLDEMLEPHFEGLCALLDIELAEPETEGTEEAAPEASDAVEGADQESGGEVAPPEEATAPSAAEGAMVNILNSSNQMCKVSYHQGGKPVVARIPGWQTVSVPASILDSPHFQGLYKRGMVRVAD